MDTVTLFMFLASYVMWIIAWGSYGEWQPRRDPFIVADVLYASACVMAFFHLTHFFQVNSTLGPLQLSLYRMLKDVLKFLVIFLMLYIAFATGVVKVYSYYVASQINLRDHNKSHYQEYHPYAKYVNISTFLHCDTPVDRQTDSQTDRQTQNQTDRQTIRHTETDRFD